MFLTSQLNLTLFSIRCLSLPRSMLFHANFSPIFSFEDISCTIVDSNVSLKKKTWKLHFKLKHSRTWELHFNYKVKVVKLTFHFCKPSYKVCNSFQIFPSLIKLLSAADLSLLKLPSHWKNKSHLYFPFSQNYIWQDSKNIFI